MAEGEHVKTQVMAEDDDVSADIVTSIVTLRENGVASCSLIANDEKGKQYLSTMSLGTRIVAKYKYEDGDDVWKTTFDGKVEKLQPELSDAGEIIGVTAYGKGYPLKLMRVADEYGSQSWKPTLTTIRKALCGYGAASGLVGDYVEKIFGGGSSGHSFDTDYIYGYLDALEISYILFPYENAFNCLVDLVNLEAAIRYKDSPEDWRGLHFIVTPDGELCLAPVGSHDVYGKDATKNIEDVWATYARATPIEVTKEMILQDFEEQEIEANYVAVAGKFVKPLNEGWTEGSASLWEYKDTDPLGEIADDDSTKVEGDYSVRFRSSRSDQYFRLKEDLNIDFSKLKGKSVVPEIAFWAKKGSLGTGGGPVKVLLMKDWTNYFWRTLNFSAENEWTMFETDLLNDELWTKEGTLEWSEVHYVGLYFHFGLGVYGDVWLDNLRFIGNVIRVAYDSTSIATKGCRMADPIKDSLASTDSLDASEDDDPLAQVALTELLKRRETVTTGKVVVPLVPTFKAGQLIHIHAARLGTTPETYNIDQDFRITEVQHAFTDSGAITTLSLNSDLKNSVPRGASDPYTVLIRAMNPDFQTKTFASLKAGGEFDIGLERLAKDYPS